MMAYNYNPSIWEAEARRLKLEAGLSYKARPCLKKQTTSKCEALS
jgi:hypothetical protein